MIRGGGFFPDNYPSIEVVYSINDLEVSFKVDLKGINETDIKEYLWDFGDGNLSYDKSPTHTYNQAGLYKVILKIIYDNDRILTTDKYIVINNMQDNQSSIDFTYNVNDLEVSFIVDFKGINESDIKDYLWEFGDGSSSTEKSPTHKYNQAGSYNVLLIVKYNDSELYATKQVTIKHVTIDNDGVINLFLKGFGDNQNLMYFALHIKGKSNIQADKTGLFAQKGVGVNNQYSEDYARDLIIHKEGDVNTKFPFSTSYETLGLSNIYSVDYGWTDENGLNLDMPFYLGYAGFNIPIKSNGFVNFVNFNIVDMTGYGLMPGYDYPSFVRCNVGKFYFNIPMQSYNANIHKNIALFTIEFNKVCTYSVTFDGFVKK